jgi:hypothetical protein
MKGIWKFELEKDFSIDLYQYHHKFSDCIFRDVFDGRAEIVGHITDGKLTILKGYQWDGCTPKFMLFGKIIGVPDFKKTYEPSLVHDFLIDYCSQHFISRAVIDKIWTKMLRANSFKLRWLYSSVVHGFRPFALFWGPCKK